MSARGKIKLDLIVVKNKTNDILGGIEKTRIPTCHTSNYFSSEAADLVIGVIKDISDIVMTNNKENIKNQTFSV